MASVRADTKKREPKEKIVCILDDLDLSWYPSEIKYAAQLWHQGMSIWEMAEILRPLDDSDNAADEVALLVIHMARQEIIRNRENGMMGSN